MSPKSSNLMRCGWLSNDPQYIKYHDEEWGRPQRDSMQLFRMLCLEGQQAGLSWITVLKKRERYDSVFYDFDPKKICDMSASEITNAVTDSGIIRHRGKVEAIINNAKYYMVMEHSGEDFSQFLWSFVKNETIVNHWKDIKEVPTQTDDSVAMSKELKKRNFKYVGPTICYAFMQACGFVNDHTVDCFCYSKYCKRNT